MARIDTITENNYKPTVQLLKKYSEEYYNGTPLVTDQEYDELYHKVLAYEKANKINNKDSITNKIGSNSKAKKRDHLSKMYSMEDIFSIEELEDWYESKTNGDTVAMTVMPKYDGCSLNLIYKNGKLVEGISRGDGTRGEPIPTEVLKVIQGIPTTIDLKTTDNSPLEIRGEVIIPLEVFDKLNESRIEQGLPTFSNPRNLASSSIRVTNVSVADRGLTFIPWGIGSGWDKLPENQTYIDTLRILNTVGFTREVNVFLIKDIETLIDKIKYLDGIRDSLPYMVDGAVIRVNGLRLAEIMGYTNKCPRYNVAYKFQAQEASTTLLDVKWQVGRTGVVTPVGLIDTVKIGGVNVWRVTLHNTNYIKNLNLKIGDTISIIRSGDVIPKISMVFTDRRTGVERDISVPRVCPECKTKLETSGAYKVCPNLNCSGRVTGSIIHYGSKKAMNIDGLGETVAETLYETGLVRELKDLYSLSYDNLVSIAKIGDKTAKNLLEAIQDSKGMELRRFIFGLGIEGIGEVASNKLANLGASWYNLTVEELSSSTGLNPIIVSRIAELKDKIHELQAIVAPIIPEVLKTIPWKIAVTGTISTSRSEFEKMLRNYGMEVQNSVTKDTTYLVAGDGPVGTKHQSAVKFSVAVVDEPKFLELLNQEINK